MRKLADALGTTPDYLISNSSEEKAKASLSDYELLSQFKAVEQTEEEDKRAIKRLIDAFITKNNFIN